IAATSGQDHQTFQSGGAADRQVASKEGQLALENESDSLIERERKKLLNGEVTFVVAHHDPVKGEIRHQKRAGLSTEDFVPSAGDDLQTFFHEFVGYTELDQRGPKVLDHRIEVKVAETLRADQAGVSGSEISSFVFGGAAEGPRHEGDLLFDLRLHVQ